MKRMISILCATVCVQAALGGAVFAGAAVEPTKDELKVQFKSREAELRELKQRGRVGESVDGYVGAVDAQAAGDAKIARLVADENRDRRVLYQILADEINKENPKAPVRATIDTVAERNALRNIERAGADEFLRVANEQWIRVKDFPRFQKLTRLKTQGKVGETGAGLVEIVQPADRADAAVAGIVDEENARRTAEYAMLAEKERVDVSVIAKRMAARNLQNARIGDMVKDDGGVWRKK